MRIRNIIIVVSSSVFSYNRKAVKKEVKFLKFSKLTGIVLAILFISMVINGMMYQRMAQQRYRLDQVHQMASESIERNTRHGIRQIDVLLETESLESMARLRWSLEELVSVFQQWVMLSGTKDQPNERLKEGLAGMEAMRNAIVNHLDRQYQNQEQQLNQYDREMLEKMKDQMERFLLIYHNSEGRLKELIDPDNPDGGLGHVAEQIHEIALLYRHSAIPNQHPVYMEIEECQEKAWEAMAFLNLEKIQADQETVRIRNGVHTYPFRLYFGEKQESRVQMDAVNGRIREYQTLQSNPGEVSLTMEEALDRALQHVKIEGEMKREVYFQPVNGTTEEPFFAFLFAPIRSNIEIVSDAFQIQISAVDGRLLQFQNGYCKTEVPNTPIVLSRQEVRRRWREELGIMTYNGLSVVRSFDTRFKPKLAHGFRVKKGGQPTMVYFDVMSGNLVHEGFHIYEPIL